MPFQARLLVDRMKSGKEGVDFVNDWKVITMFIGGNDLCDYCGDRVTNYNDNTMHIYCLQEE